VAISRDDLLAEAARLRAEAVALQKRAEAIEAIAEQMPPEGLPTAQRSVTVTGDDVLHLPASKLRIAKSRRGASPLVRELHRRKLTMRELHRALVAEGHTISDAHLSRILTGIHPCPDELREPIERLTSGAIDDTGALIPGLRMP
jgi:hypothetical protein